MLDFSRKTLWRAGPVAHIGSVAVNGAGTLVVTARYSEGLQRYGPAGQDLGRWSLPEPCGLAALSYTGDLTLAAGLSGRLFLLDATGGIMVTQTLEKPVAAIAFSALGDRCFVAMQDGSMIGYELAEGP